MFPVAMYWIAIFEIRSEPDSTGYQTNYLAGTGTGYTVISTVSSSCYRLVA